MSNDGKIEAVEVYKPNDYTIQVKVEWWKGRVRMKQETPITLHVKSVIEDDGNQEVIEFRTTGFYYVKQNKVYLSYYEEHDLGKVKTIVKVSEGEVLVMRSGAVKMNQRFVTGASTIAKYKIDRKSVV